MNWLEFLDTSEAELGKMTTHALLTRFTTPIFLDLYIPDEYNTRKLMFVLRDKLDGKSVKPEKVNTLTYLNESLRWDAFNGLAGRVGMGIESAFKFRGSEDVERAYRDQRWYVAESVLSNNHVFGSAHFGGWGDMLRYRDGKRAEWFAKTQEYFNPQENQEFDRIYSLIAPFVGKTNASAKIDRE